MREYLMIFPTCLLGLYMYRRLQYKGGYFNKVPYFINPYMSTPACARDRSSSWIIAKLKSRSSSIPIQRARTKPCPSDQYPFGRLLSFRWRSSPPQLPLHRHKHRRNPAASHLPRDLGPRHPSTSPRLYAPSLFSTRRMAHRHRHPHPLDHAFYLVFVPA